jgi:hypothetical protein
MERFVNAIIEPAKIAYLFDGRRLGKKLDCKFKGLIVRRISSHMASATESRHSGCYWPMQDEKYAQMFTTPFNPQVLIVLA